ncbi:MAG: polyphenol oxidase family protein [Candidatus Velamenicoccus archaeovorus]
MEPFERRPLPGGMHALVSRRLERSGVLAAFLERSGGYSHGPYASLNGSFGVGDDPAAVAANRRKVAEAFGVTAFPIPGFVHGTRLMPVGRGRIRDGYDGPPRAFALADGLHTRSAGMPLGAFSADCVIGVMAAPAEPRVVLFHAGWRGLASGMIGRAADLFPQRAEVHVALGPAIGPCHYEVGEEVVAAVGAGCGRAVAERRRGRTYLDLVATTRGALRREGIRRVDDTGTCTACERDRFFSFRRDGATGRHLALAMRLR